MSGEQLNLPELSKENEIIKDLILDEWWEATCKHLYHNENSLGNLDKALILHTSLMIFAREMIAKLICDSCSQHRIDEFLNSFFSDLGLEIHERLQRAGKELH